MATDFGPATGNGELYLQTGATSGVFIEQHVQGPVTTAASSGVPGGLSGPASAQNNLGPGNFSGVTDAQAYGTVSNGTAVVPIFFNTGVANPTGAGNLVTFVIKNPA